MSKRKAERRVEEAAQAAREAEILRKAGTLESPPVPRRAARPDRGIRGRHSNPRVS